MDRSAVHLPSPPGSQPDGKVSRFHPAPSRNDVAILQPVLVKLLDNTLSTTSATTGTGTVATATNHTAGDTLTFITFHANAVITVSKSAVIRFWVRPLPPLHDRVTGRKARPRGMAREGRGLKDGTVDEDGGGGDDDDDDDRGNRPIQLIQDSVNV